MKRYFESKRVVHDPERLLAHLINNKFGAEGVSTQGDKTFIFMKDSENRSPEALLKSYVDQDYYEFTADRKGFQEPTGEYLYQIKRDGVDTLTFTITKRSGKNNAVKPDNETIDFHWHGPKLAFVSASKVNLVKGVGTVSVGRLYVSGAAIAEAVHPKEEARRATAFVEFVRILR